MEDFLNYWDEVFASWVENGEMPPSESYWKEQEKIEFYPELMPEPYLGDPHHSSLVILNYNPCAHKYDLDSEKGNLDYKKDPVHHSGLDDPLRMCYHYAHNYRQSVAKGGYLGRFSDPMYASSILTRGGKCWWCPRLEWIKELIPESPNIPFALELCGWHSNKWVGIKYTKPLLSTLRHRLSAVIEESINCSDLGIGLCVGAQWGATVLPYFGYKDVTAEVMGLNDYSRGWDPLGMKRNYRILRNDNQTYIINTWLSRGYKKMDVPTPEYRPIEKEIINKIRKEKE
ncbi:MAG: hypothetical protein K2K97_07640 [Muribaculaceae bacterium]|nr:hypothetical protein [Muribaculaceae bacterium]